MKCVTLIAFITAGICCVRGECNELPVVEFSTNNITQSGPYPEGTAVHFTCNKGYNPHGDFIQKCKSGIFVGSLKCEAITCPDITVEHGSITNQPSYEAGTMITFQCDKGYDMSGQATLYCGVSGEWSPSVIPTCSPKDCGEFGTITNGHLFMQADNGMQNKYGSSVRVTCDQGYLLNGPQWVKCGDSGQWGEKPSCTRTECPSYPGLLSNCIDQQIMVNNLVYMTCKDDVSVTSDPDVTSASCQPDGKWNNLKLGCYCDCKIENLNNMQPKSTLKVLNGMSYVPHNEPLTWSCTAGYEKSISDPIMCKDGNMTQPSCMLIHVPNTNGTGKNETGKDGTGKGNPKSDKTWVIIIVALIIILVASGILVAVLLFCKKHERFLFKPKGEQLKQNVELGEKGGNKEAGGDPNASGDTDGTKPQPEKSEKKPLLEELPEGELTVEEKHGN